MTAAVPATAQIHVEGATGPGSFYVIDVPAAWNGDLVIYAHAIVQAEQPVAPPEAQDGYALIRASLLSQGYAVAASSYSANGWAVDDAVRRTHQLSGLFTAAVSRPRRTLLMGHSMGSLVLVKLAERYGRQYDGVLAICGPLGGALAELQYVGDLRVTLDYYFPGLLPGDTFFVPPGTQFLSPFDPGGPSPLFLQAVAAFTGNPQATALWVNAAGLPAANPTEMVNSALYAVGFLVRYTNDFIERVQGKIPYENIDTVYQVTLADPLTNAVLSAQLNAGVRRYEADSAAVNYYARNYTPTGDIAVPVITLHTTRDPAIPFEHEELFADAVAAAGRSHLLDTRAINRWGHCTITPAEIGASFADLVFWVETGIRP